MLMRKKKRRVYKVTIPFLSQLKVFDNCFPPQFIAKTCDYLVSENVE